jgi:hypothetical protein
MVSTPEEKDDEEPRYSTWLDLPLSTREAITAKDAKAARKALQALDTRTTIQRMLGEPPRWRSALAQKGLVDWTLRPALPDRLLSPSILEDI